MSVYEVPVRCTVRITVDPSAEYAIERFVGLPEGNNMGWTPGCTHSDILNYLAFSCAAYNRGDASMLDGFADLDRDLITMDDYDYQGDDF